MRLFYCRKKTSVVLYKNFGIVPSYVLDTKDEKLLKELTKETVVALKRVSRRNGMLCKTRYTICVLNCSIVPFSGQEHIYLRKTYQNDVSIITGLCQKYINKICGVLNTKINFRAGFLIVVIIKKGGFFGAIVLHLKLAS